MNPLVLGLITALILVLLVVVWSLFPVTTVTPDRGKVRSVSIFQVDGDAITISGLTGSNRINIDGIAVMGGNKIEMVVNQPDLFTRLLKERNITFQVVPGLQVTGVGRVPGALRGVLAITGPVPSLFLTETGDLVLETDESHIPALRRSLGI